MTNPIMNRQILHGDALDKLKLIDDDSMDSIITDPPYGYSFMNKSWDKAVISVDIWKECLRVLKSGAFACIMSAPRQDVMSRMIVNLQDAGFVTSFTPVFWSYATGFPKASNISKMIDRKLGVKPEIISTEKINSGGFAHMMKENKEQGYRPNDYYKEKGNIIERVKPSSPQAKKLDGLYSGFQPKPAVEVILMCMKPLSEKNYTDQAMKNGKGGTWLDDCRIPYRDEKDSGDPNRCKGYPLLDENKGWNQNNLKNNITIGEKGRFPANLLVSDDVLNDKKIHSSGKIEPHHKISNTLGNSDIYGDYSGDQSRITHGDSGSFSRYFDLDAWAELHLSQFIITPKASKSEKNKGLDNFVTQQVNDGGDISYDNTFQRGKTERKNTHPTVKPVSLFSYLVKMCSREGDVILDPFMGSGTTAVTCEMLHREWIGIERERYFVDIANARIDRFLKQQKLDVFS